MFIMFMKFSDWIYEREGRSYGLSLLRLAECVFDFVCEQGHADDVRLGTCPGRRRPRRRSCPDRPDQDLSPYRRTDPGI